MKKIVYRIILLLLVSSCGFQMLYSQNLKQKLSQIKIVMIQNNLNGFMLKEQISVIINPQQIKSEKKLILEINHHFKSNSIAINSGGSSSRERIYLTVNYTLMEIDSKKILKKGSLSVSDAMEINDNKFSNYTSEKFVEQNLIKSISQEIVDFVTLSIK